MATDVFPNPGGPQTLTSRVTEFVKLSSIVIHALSRPTKCGISSGMDESGTKKSKETIQANDNAGNIDQIFILTIKKKRKKLSFNDRACVIVESTSLIFY